MRTTAATATLVALAAVVAAVTPLRAKDAPPAPASPALPDIARAERVGKGAPFFDGTLDEALREAAGRNVPVIVFGVLEGEEENERFRLHFLGDPLLDAAVDDTVLLLANAGSHEWAKVTGRLRGERVEREVCAKYETTTCDAHGRNWDAIYKRFSTSDVEWKLPEGIVLRPDGVIHARVSTGDPPKVATLLAAADEVRAETGLGLTFAQWSEVRRLDDGARAAEARGDGGEAWRTWLDVLARIDVGPDAAAARAGQEWVVEAIAKEVRRLTGYLRGEDLDDVAWAAREMTRLAHAWRASPVAAELTKSLDREQAKPSRKASVRRGRFAGEADWIWADVRALRAAGDDKAARKRAKDLLAKRFEGTEARAEAAQAFPDVFGKDGVRSTRGD